jgi:hypothetical protein
LLCTSSAALRLGSPGDPSRTATSVSRTPDSSTQPSTSAPAMRTPRTREAVIAAVPAATSTSQAPNSGLRRSNRK